LVSGTDIKFRKSNNSGLGESMSGNNIVTATENNYFDDVSASEQVGGHTEYRCMYVIDGHASEDIKNAEIWMSSDNPNSAFSTIKWAIDPIAQHPLYPFTYSIHCNGIDGRILFDDDATLWSQALTKYTFTFWIFPTKAGDGNDRLVLGHGGASNGSFRVFIDLTSSVRIRHQIKDGSGTTFTAYSDSLELNKWNFICCRYDSTAGSQNLRIFVNNVQGAGTANVTATLNIADNLRIGDTTNDYEGYVKDFRWFTNKSLSTAQIDDIYTGDEDAVGADAWYKMHESAGPIIDTITGTKDATLNAGCEPRSSQEIPNNTTSPVGITWLGASNGPVTNEPNLGRLKANGTVQCPVWIQWIVNDTEQDADNDFCVFVVQGEITTAGTPSDPTGGGDDPTPSPIGADFTFAVCGDWGAEDATDEVVDLIVKNSPKPKICIGVGDNAYDSGSDAVKDWIDKMKPIDDHQGSTIRFETAFGNHDNAESEDAANESAIKNHFGYSKTFYSFNYENVHFLCLDNTEETSFSSGSEQYNFAKTDLENARKDGDIDWIIVYAHKPMFGGDSQHSYNDGNFNQAYFPLFDTYKVDLMCFGHNHHMSQSKQVKYNSNDAESPTIVDSATPYVGGVGRIHIVSGRGGHDAEDPYEVDSFSQTEWKNDSDLGALFCSITNSAGNTTLTGIFKDTDGGAIRTFVITRTT